MVLNLMEGDPISKSNLISSIKCLSSDGKQHGTIKTLLKNFILPEPNMAIKENKLDKNTCVYSVPIKPPLTMTDRMKSINEAKQAFLNATVTSNNVRTKNDIKRHEPIIHYAQLDITTRSEDTRSTGGGTGVKLKPNSVKPKEVSQPVDISHNNKKRPEPNQRKVSFKIKNATTSYKRPPLAAKTVTIPSNKVSLLTEKFNSLNESQMGTPKQGNVSKTVEELHTAQKGRSSVSNSSTPSSTLSSSPNIKIVVRQRRGSKKRNNKKRCSSVDSMDKLILSDGSTAKIRVLRSKSEGTKFSKSSKKRLKYHPDSSEQQSGSDSVDGNLVKTENIQPKKEKLNVENNVKNVIKKFECEIIAQSISNGSTLNKNPNRPVPTATKEKPKVPEKKSSLVLTKNIVVKDGIPKIKTIKPVLNESIKIENKKILPSDSPKKKEPIYDRKKFKTNYIHTDKLPLKVVEIIPEDIESAPTTSNAGVQTEISVNVTQVNISQTEETELCQAINSEIAPNESFLWRRKSNSQLYSDLEKTIPDNAYGFVSVTVNNKLITCSDEQEEISIKESSQTIENESQNNVKTEDPNMDFESNLVEAYNKEVLLGYTTKPKKEAIVENDYEVLEPRDSDNIVIIPLKTLERTSKINCPLPEIPKDNTSEQTGDTENVYQCLLEMRSHPEGDESSLHNYELCENQMEERTRGDGDSDDGYEYCKSLIKPYCLTSSSGIQIAEDYQPNVKPNDKNYAISKSVSGTSTVSYEKIGSERIYEKIPARPVKSKNSSPTYSSRRSSISDYGSYNDGENIYDTIKHADATSLSHCYESIPNSPSMVKMRNNLRKQLASAVQKRLSFDTVSNISQSTMSSEQKTNSLYGQRSVISYNGQEIAFQVPSSETSVSDKSDRSDDWVDVSDEEKNDEQKIIIVRERSRSRKSPISWSQKVRHQWQNSPKKSKDKDCDSSDSGHLYESLDLAPAPPPPVHGPRPPHTHIEEDFDSFDSDSDTDDHDKSTTYAKAPPLPASRLPTPPTGGQYTLTKIASAAQRKMRQIKRNLTKRYSVAMDGNPFTKSSAQNGIYEVPNPKAKKVPIYANCEKKENHPVYSNITFNETKPVLNKSESPSISKGSGFQEELKTVIGEKRFSNGEIPPPLPEKPSDKVEKPVTPTSESSKKDGGTLSRKTYFSFKSRFRRATSIAVDINDVPSALKMNSTFYLTDSMDGDSGFSNCSDQGAGVTVSAETLSPLGTARRKDGTKLRTGWAESSPCLALERPSVPPPPPPSVPGSGGPGTAVPGTSGPGNSAAGVATTPPVPAASNTDLSAVNEELKRLLPTLSRKDKSPRARTSWYAECGSDSHTPSTSWYAEAGLYQAGNISSSSGASSGSHPASPLPHSLFTHEPLYQFYNAAKVESVCRETGDSDSDAYEPGGRGLTPLDAPPALVPPASVTPPPGVVTAPRPSAMALIAPRGPARTLWCEVPEVVNSTVLSSLAPVQKRLQEAKFELLTSEASYLNSLSVLETHFIAHPAFREPHILPRDDWETLFSTIIPVRKCSQLLMNELEKCWQENILLQGICDIVRHHAEQHFQVYVKYCENQTLMVKALQRLREKPVFAAALKRLESHPACQSLSLHSFLMLPMQRVTRLPLLLDAVLKNLSSEDEEYEACMHALATLNDYVSQCNEGARNTERIEEMYRLSQIIEFPATVRDPPSLGPACSRRDRNYMSIGTYLIPAYANSKRVTMTVFGLVYCGHDTHDPARVLYHLKKPIRWLVRSGEMTQVVWKTDEMKLTFGKKFHKIPLHVFLFNDLLVITKKKSEEAFVCVEHCPRSLLEVCSSEAAGAARHALLLTLLENHEGRTVEMVVSCPSETDASRWAEALCPPRAAPGEAVYAGWDCPQVCALYAYRPAQPDELPLSEGDVINVTRKTSEGWYYGERTRDGEAGWFPGAYTAEVASPHVRARNLRQRYRLLALSGTYLGQKKRQL